MNGPDAEDRRVLVVNAGSSSVKLRVVRGKGTVETSADTGPPDGGMIQRLGEFIATAGPLDAVGHRVAHGGSSFRAPVVVDDEVRRTLGRISDLAPLHNPLALAGVDAARRLLPDIPSVACFDTAFHATIRPEASTYAVPDDWTGAGVRRYGFHGLSCAWAVGRAAELLRRPVDQTRLVVCHLGSGASATAVDGGRSVDTTMGFTPLEGLVMSTRSGDVDPGAVLWMLRRGLSEERITDALECRSGLLGLTGGASADMREILRLRGGGDERARLAVGIYVHRLRAKVAAMTAATAGTDALVFTGGVGEHAAAIRAEALAGLGWMGAAIDPAANAKATSGDADVSGSGARVAVLVIQAREDLEIVRQCGQLLAPREPAHHPIQRHEEVAR